MNTERIEKAFLILTGAMLISFLTALFYAAWGMGMHLPDRAGEILPSAVRETPPFDNPGVFETAPGRYDVVVIGFAWGFEPDEIRIPAGAEVTFKATSVDVVHGFHIDETRVNVMLLPGQVTELTYRFDEPGEYLLVCHEYCGAGHHLMSGRVIVE